jgi:adenosylcobinamide-GDP ribazoletransferase
LQTPQLITEIDRLLLTDLVSAFMLLTRLPVARLARLGRVPDLARCVWAFPIVGVVVNGMGGLIYWLAHKVGMPPLLAAAWTLAVTMAVTGAFHEDGLADTADGFGGGVTPARKMDIMRDSRIGTYGAAVLVLSVMVRAAAISALGQPGSVMTAMILAGALGRSGMLLLLMILPPARADGMGASVGKPRVKSVALALAVAIAASVLSLPILPATAAVVLGFGCSLLLAKLAAAQIGGQTGDVLGATEVVIECVVLTVIAGACAG